MARTKQQAQTPSAVLSADFNELYDKVFGTAEKPNSSQETADALASLSTSDLICLRAAIGLRESQFHDVNAAISSKIAERPLSEFPSEDTVFAVKDSRTQAIIGGVKVETKVTKKRSTIDKKVAQKVKDELNSAGLLATYTKTSVELINDALYEAKANGTLPASVSALLTETEKRDRVSTFVPSHAVGGE